MAVNTTTLGDLLVRVYDKGTVVQLQNLTVPLLSYLGEARDFTVGGEGLFFGVNASGDEGYGFIAEEGALPTPQNELTKQAKVDPKVFVGATRITGLGRAISMRDPHAFASGLQYHLDYKLKRMTRYWETALFRDGKGQLALCAGAPAAAQFDVDTPGAMWIRRNMFIEIFDGATDVRVAGPVKVTDSDIITNKITTATDESATLGDNDKIFLAGTQPAVGGTLVEREFVGLEAAIATTGTYLNINRSTVPEWESNVVDASGNPVTEDRLLQAENRVLMVGGVEMGDIRNFRCLVHPNQRRKYFSLVVPQKQFTGLSLDAGYSKLTWNGHEMVETYNCPEKKWYMGDFSQLQKFTAPEGELKIDTTFGPPIKWAQGFDAGIAYWRSYCNYAVRKPNGWVVIDDLANVTDR